MNAELPEGWMEVDLAAIADIALGKMLNAKRTRGRRFPYLRNANVRWGEFDLGDVSEMHFEDDELARFTVVANDLLICEGGEPGRSAVWPGSSTRMLYQKALLRVRPFQGIDPRWVMYSLQLDAASGGLGSYFTGTTIKHFPQQAASRYRLPLAPTSEQNRIVARIEALFAKIRSSQQRLENIPTILKRFRQSVLSAACCGRLTADWRVEHSHDASGTSIVSEVIKAHETAGGHKRGNAAPPTDGVHDWDREDLPNRWDLTELRNIVDPARPVTYGILKPGPHIEGGVRYVRVADYPSDRLNLSSIRKTSREIDKLYARARLRVGDILLSIRGTVGRVIVVPQTLEEANITQDTARLTIQRAMDTSYVAWLLRAPAVQKRMQNAVKGVAVRGINIGDVRALQIAVPALNEQREIVKRIERMFALAGRIEARYAKAAAQVNRLTQVVLAKAFRGELVSTEAELAHREKRSYEPASMLLERIRSEQKDRGDQNMAGKNGELTPRRKSLRNNNGARLPRGEEPR